MKYGVLTLIGLAFALSFSGCKSGEGGDGSREAQNTRFSGTFTARVDGVTKDGSLGIAYEAQNGDTVTGEFDLDDTTGSLGGSKNFEGTKNGDMVHWHSTQCPGDTFQLDHDLNTNQVTFAGTLCQGITTFNIVNGSATMVGSP